jgi:AraC-like DNA-binding protein
VSAFDATAPKSRSRLVQPATQRSAAPAARLFGDLGVGPLGGVPKALQGAGVEPAAVLRSVGLEPGFLDDEAHRLPFPLVGRLLQACVDATRLPHFGLLAGQQFELRMFGVLGFLMRNAPTVRAALRALMLHRHLEDRGAAVGFSAIDMRRVALTYAVVVPDTPALGAIYDVALMVGWRVLKLLCGPRWRPVELHLAHAAPRNAAPYRHLFEAPVRFNAPLSTLVFESRWLDQPVSGADPALHRVLQRLLDEQERQLSRSLSDRIRLVLSTSVLAGTASAEYIADLFSLSERSLRRHLAREGSTIKQLIAETRMVVASQLLEQTRMSLGDIAAALHYADATALSRAFRRWFGQSPTQWRRVQDPTGDSGRK